MPGTSDYLDTQKNLLKVDINEVPIIVRTVLAQLGWGNFFFEKGLATGDRRKQLRRANLSRNLEHRIQVRWRKSIERDGVYVRVQVDDSDGYTRKDELRDICGEVLGAIFARAQELKEQGPEERRTTYGSAKWAQQEDLRAAGYVIDRTEAIDPLRFVLGLTDDGREVRALAEDSVRHAIVSGPTGSGKTSSILIPNLLKRTDASVIVTEATAGNEPPDLFEKTSGYRKAHGSSIFYFNPDDLSSHRINPIDQIKNVDDAQILTNLIIENTNKKDGGFGEQIWDNAERHLLTALLLDAAGKKASLLQVREMLTNGQEGMAFKFAESPVDKARSEYRAFYNVSTEGFRNGVISGLMARLNLWVNPRIAALTAATDFDMAAIDRGVFTLYLAVPSQKGHLKPLASLVFNYVLSRVMENEKRTIPLFLCLDEFTNFGRIPDFANKISIIRHQNLGTILGFQDYAQLEQTYGKEDARKLWANIGTKVLFKPNDLDMAKKISETLGTETYYEKNVSSTGQVHEKEFGRPLMNPSEILALAEDRALVFTRKTAPIKLKPFTWRDFVSETTLRPPRREKLQVDESLISTCAKAEESPPWQTKWAKQKPKPKELDVIAEYIVDTTEKDSEPEGKEPSQDKPPPEVKEPKPKKPEPKPEPKNDEPAEEDRSYERGAII